MKFIQTLYFDKSLNPFKDRFGWAAPEYHLMGWALSCLQLQQLYTKVDLYCNNKAALLLRDQLGLPYANVYETHNNLNTVNEKLWALPKIFTYSMQDEPFLHVDGDVFIFKKFPASLLYSELIAQNAEEVTEYHVYTQKELIKYFTYFPNCVKNDFKSTDSVKSVNAGILGGNNITFIKEYSELAFKYVNRNIRNLPFINAASFNIFFEQYLFYSLAKEKGVPIEFFIKEITEDNNYQRLCDFHEVPCKKSYLHLVGSFKTDEHICRQMAAKLRELYPDYYYRIISICKTKCTSTKVSLYSNDKFVTVGDYIKFKEQSKESYSNTLYEGISKVPNKISSTSQASETRVLTLLKKQIGQMAELSDIDKREAKRDLIKFSKNIRKVLRVNNKIGIATEYLYGRDLESVSWYCELFGNDAYIPDKIIFTNAGIKIIKSKFNWGGLLNKIERVGLIYYQALELKAEEYYNLMVLETFGDGYSIHDLDELEKIILEHLSEPSSIKDLLGRMHIYIEDDIIKNHFDEFEHLIIVMLKQLVLKKAISPFKNISQSIEKVTPSY